jgi:hypothetical protein
MPASAAGAAASQAMPASAAGAAAARAAADGAAPRVQSYTVAATVRPWVDTSGCNATACIDPKTPLPPSHGAFVFSAVLQPQLAAGGSFQVTATTAGGGANSSIVLRDVTYGDVYYCSGQSNMALETFYTYSADSLKQEIAAGKYSQLRHYMFGSMSDHFESLAPQWVTAWNSLSAGPAYTWHKVNQSAALPSLIPSASSHQHPTHSAFAQFSATCMYVLAPGNSARAIA